MNIKKKSIERWYIDIIFAIKQRVSLDINKRHVEKHFKIDYTIQILFKTEKHVCFDKNLYVLYLIYISQA